MRQIQKSVGESIARAKFVALTADESVATAVRAMAAEGTDCVVIVDDGKLIGIFSETDFLRRVSAENRDPRATRLDDVMTTDPQTLHSHDSISYAINRMVVDKRRHVAIVDDRHRPISVLDVRLVMLHLVKVFAEVEKEPELQVNDEWTDIGGG